MNFSQCLDSIAVGLVIGRPDLNNLLGQRPGNALEVESFRLDCDAQPHPKRPFLVRDSVLLYVAIMCILSFLLVSRNSGRKR